MSVLANYEPKNVFSYFEKLCTIPRGSGNTDGVASYLVSFAKEHGLESYRDAANNVIIRKPASAGYENADTIILQGHHDMVCEKEEGLDFDFTKDAIQPVIDGDWIRAKGSPYHCRRGNRNAWRICVGLQPVEGSQAHQFGFRI